MLYKETIAAAERVAIKVSEGHEYHSSVQTEVLALQKLPGYNLTVGMRCSVECQDKVFQLLQMYKQAYDKLTDKCEVHFPVSQIGGPNA